MKTKDSFLNGMIRRLLPVSRPPEQLIECIGPADVELPVVNQTGSKVIQEFEQRGYAPGHQNIRHRDENHNSFLAEIRKEFPWANEFVIDPHWTHLTDVVFVLREIEHIGGTRLTGQLKFLRIATVSDREKSFDGNSAVGLRLSFSFGLKAGPDSVFFEKVLEELRVRIVTQSFKLTPKQTAEPEETFTATAQVSVDGPSATVLSDNAGDVVDELIAQSDCTDAKKFKAFAKKIEKVQGPKRLALINGETLSALQADRFPNFTEFVAYLTGQSALAAMGNGVFRLPPVLLIGAPGIGKTAFLSRLAKVIKTEFLSINMAAAQTGSSISGGDIHWSNSRQGQLFNKLVFGETANPIVFLDEIDKIATTQYDPAGALYPLLERKTAAEFEDLSLPGLRINASHVVWFAAANSLDSIEPALLSRFRVFHIPEPTKAQMPVVVESVYSDLLDGEAWGDKFSPLSEGVLQAVAAVPPREVKQMLESAIAVAAIDGRCHLCVEDLTPLKRKSAIGF